MGTLRRFVDNIFKRFAAKQPKSITFNTKARGPRTNIADRAQEAYKSYAGRMRKRGQRAKSFRKWLKDQPSPPHTSFGTFRALRSLPGRTDFSKDADVHIQRVKGERPTRELHRHMMRIRARSQAKTTNQGSTLKGETI